MRHALAAIFFSATVLAACAGEPPAAPSAEAVRGRAFAQDACAQCHAVGPGEAASPNPLAPPFQEIAETPGMTRIALSAWMQGAHASMPQLIVDQDRIDDLAAYLASLED